MPVYCRRIYKSIDSFLIQFVKVVDSTCCSLSATYADVLLACHGGTRDEPKGRLRSVCDLSLSITGTFCKFPPPP